MVKKFGDKCQVEGDRLWSENEDECPMGVGVNKIFADWGGDSPGKNPCLKQFTP